MKLALLIMAALTLVSCSQEKAKNNARFSFEIGGVVTQGPQPGGIMIYGRNAAGTLKFGQLLTNSSQTIPLPNDSWTFYAIGWAGPNPMTGKTRCAQASVNLAGTDASVNLVMTAAKCNEPVFTSPAHIYSGDVQKLRLYSCTDISGLGAGDDCSSDLGPHDSVQVIIPNYFGSSSDAKTPGPLFTSACMPFHGTTGLADTLFTLPLGSAPLGMAVEIHAYESASCTGTKEVFDFKQGLGQGPAIGDTLLVDGSGTPEHTKIFLESAYGLPAPTAITLNSPIYSNSLTGSVTVGGLTAGATVKISTNPSCSDNIGSMTASSSTETVAITLVWEAQVTLHASQSLGGLTSSCSIVNIPMFVGDTTPPPPTAGAYWVPNGAPTNSTTITLNWGYNNDTLSGLKETQLGLYTNPTCSSAAVSTHTIPHPTISHTFTGLVDANYYVKVVMVDNAGNLSTPVCSPGKIIDTTPPAAASALAWSLTSPSNANNIIASWTKSISADSVTQLFIVYATPNCSGSPVNTSNFNSTPQTSNWSPTTDGATYSFKIQTFDAANNYTDSGCSPNLVIDKSVAMPTSVTLTSAPSPSNDASPSYSINGVETGATVYLYKDSSCTQQVASGVAGGSSITLTSSNLSVDNVYFYAAKQIDVAGNVSGCRASGGTYVLDTVGPPLPVIRGITATTGDTLVDWNLASSAQPIIHWQSQGDTNQYKVSIWNYDNSSQLCAEGTVGSGAIQYPYTGCSLNPNEGFTVRVSALDTATNATTNAIRFSKGWVETEPSSAPSAREDHTAVWANDEMIIWGGTDTNGDPISGGKVYDPITNDWNSVQTTNAPSARALHSAVWTGTYMIVWGGMGVSSTPLSSGSRFDPSSSGTWTNISSSGAPTARAGHLAVWDAPRNRMIIWGGDDGTQAFNTGASYNVSGNTWTSITTSGAPSARSGAAYGIVGNYLIIWGGVDHNGNALNSGAKFDLVNNSWTTVTASGAPSARHEMAFTSTGNDLFIYGGYNGSSRLGDAYRFNGTTWTILSGSGLSARKQSRMTTNGQRILVWGGHDASGFANDGKVYDLTSSQWHAVGPGTMPGVRSMHTMISTGNMALIFGGLDDNGVLDTGAGIGY